MNVGRYRAEGVDVTVSSLFSLGNAGFLTTDLVGTRTLGRGMKTPLFDIECVGYFGEACGQPNATWRHRLRTTWETNVGVTVSLAWRRIGSVDNDDGSPNPDIEDPEAMELWEINGSHRIPAYDWFDLALSTDLAEGVRLTFGVNNIFDEEPPLLPSFADYAVIGLYANYDPLGRFIFTNVRFDF